MTNNRQARNNTPHFKELTPDSVNCGIAACPALFETSSGTYVLIGRAIAADEVASCLPGRVGEGEAAIEIPRELLSEL